MLKIFHKLLVLSIAIMISSCSVLTYKDTIYQGNKLDKEKIAKITIGMSKADIIAILGQPNLINPIDENKWAYVYSKEKQSQPKEVESLQLQFKEDKLSSKK